MMYKIEIFLLVSSLIYCLKFLSEFLLKFTDENPEPIKVSVIEKIFLLVAVSYIITFIIT